MYLIVGLGNPGEKYAKNRHNIGFRVVEAVAAKYDLGDFNKKYKGEFLQGSIAGSKVSLLKPMTFMNLSGGSVRECATFYKINPKNILVIHDEVDLEFARVKVKNAGGSGGHNGLKSIDSNIGNGYNRLRFGVGRSRFSEDTSKFVLSDFSKKEEEKLDELVNLIADNIPMLFEGKDSEFMNKVTLETRKIIDLKESDGS